MEASPKNYPKRDAYLRYLVRYGTEHTEYGAWLKELGDRAFDKAEFEAAEDWYLRALPHIEDKPMLRYRMAWVYWNQKQRIKSFDEFIMVYAELSPQMRSQVRKDVAKLWWEIGSLPNPSYERFLKLEKADQKLFVEELLTSAPKLASEAEKVEMVFIQLKKGEEPKRLLLDFLAQGYRIPEKACSLFKEVLEPEHVYPRNYLIDCAKSDPTLPPPHLLSFFQWIPESERTESINWVHAETILKDGKKELAIQLLLESRPLDTRSPKYIEFTQAQILTYDRSEFRTFASNVPHDVIKALLQAKNNAELLERLQAVDPDVWIPYQEKLVGSKSAPKSYLIRKAVWQAQREPHNHVELEKIVSELFKQKLNPSETGIRKYLELMEKRKDTKLPDTFDGNFTKAYDAWLADLDRGIKILQGASDEWKILSLPLFRAKISENIESLKNEIEQVQLPEESSKSAEGKNFESQKQTLKTQLEEKYSSYIASETTGDMQ